MNFVPLNERFFENIDGTLYCFFKSITEAGLSVNYYKKEKSEGNRRMQFLDHPTDKRFSLVAFESLSESHKEKITTRFGNPYNFIIREPILAMITRDKNAEQFFLNYRYNNKSLPISRVRQYTRACAILTMLNSIEENRNKPIKDLGITVPDFYNHLKEIIDIEKKNGTSDSYESPNQLYSKFPASYDKLRTKLTDFKTTGPGCVIDKMYGNDSALKVKDELAEAHLLSLIENPNQYDDVLICMMYNVWAEQNNYKTIIPRTVTDWRKKKAVVITMGREGNNAFNERFIRQVKGQLPSIPLALVEHDDNNLDFLFTDENNYEFNKYVAICVIDSRTRLLLGKSYIQSRTPSPWQVHHAYLDAMYYIRHLTGSWHLPFEVKADKWASKSLTPFYEKLGKNITPGHGNKHRGYIEQFFGSPLWKRCQKLVSQQNYTGNNMSSKNRGVNEEMVRASAKVRPMIGVQAETQIENFFTMLRTMPDFKRSEMEGALSKEQQFLNEWSLLKEEDKRPISDEQFLLTFGITHNPDRKISITNRGVEPQINNQKLSYDLPEAWMYHKLIGAGVNVIYDPFDLSRVLITNNDDIRFIAKTAQMMPRAMKDQYTGSRTYLNALLAEKKDIVRKVASETETRRSLISDDLFDPEALLQGGVMIKELKNEAEQRLLEGTNGATIDDDPYNMM